MADVVAFSFCCFPSTITLTADLTPFHDGLDSVDGSVNPVSYFLVTGVGVNGEGPKGHFGE